ncbi:MAG: hypothetical protein IPK71_04205 [Myxococcales bacterium]|nr:hypothetical protein [Myxococcales bacterium]
MGSRRARIRVTVLGIGVTLGSIGLLCTSYARAAMEPREASSAALHDPKPYELGGVERESSSEAARPKEPVTCGYQALVSAALVVFVGIPGVLFFARLAVMANRAGPTGPVAAGAPPAGRRGPQIAGERCGHCRKRVIAENEAARCPSCDVIVHRDDCMARHVAEHRDEPYR